LKDAENDALKYLVSKDKYDRVGSVDIEIRPG